MIRRTAMMLVSALVMAGVLYFASLEAAPYIQPATPLYIQIGALGALVLLAMIVYFSLAFLLGGADLSTIRRSLKRRAKPKETV